MIGDMIRAVLFLAGCLLLLAVLAYDVWRLLREAAERWRRAGQWIEQEIADLDASGDERDEPAARPGVDGSTDVTVAGTGERR